MKFAKLARGLEQNRMLKNFVAENAREQVLKHRIMVKP
jgi:hypothetical protein